MRKIASPTELQAEIRSIMAFIQGHGPNGKPNREVIASKLRELADRVSMEFKTPEALEEYLKEHPDADKSKHTVKKLERDDAPGSSEIDKKNEQKDMAHHLDFAVGNMSLSKPSMDGLREITRDLRNGQAKAKDLEQMAEDLDFDISKLRDKKDAKSKKQLKRIEDVATFLRNTAKKL